MRLIFLDIDGVLNSRAFLLRRVGTLDEHHAYYLKHGFDGRYEIDPDAVALLNGLVERTDAHLVLSSTWRLGNRNGTDGLAFTKHALALNGFAHGDRFIGRTPHLTGDDGEGNRLVRGHEIAAFLRDARKGRKAESFVIIDDDGDMAHLASRLVQTDGEVGLTADKCEEATRVLSTPRTKATGPAGEE